jgi:hypothetical protein
VLRCAALQPCAEHFFTEATLHLHGDEREWASVAGFAGLSPGGLRLLHQVHGRTVAEASAAERERWQRPEADAVISDDPSVALVVRVADCAPLLIADRRLGVVAAVHAGWRSTMRRIAAATIEALANAYRSDAGDLVVAIGPSLGACCGEMGEDVVEAFRREGHGQPALDAWFDRAPGRRARFDLWRANVDQLVQSGVPPGAIHSSGLCTRTHAGVFHSYRAAGPQAGRMAAVIRAKRAASA